MALLPSISFLLRHGAPGLRSATIVLLACSGIGVVSSALAQSGDGAVADKAVMVFRDVCLATAPSYEKAMTVARKFGIKPQMDLGASEVGMAPDNSFSVQVRPKKECAVTAESNPGPDVAEQFLSVVAKAAGVSAASLTGVDPIKITLRGQTFVVRHDRKGGEAYVILNPRGL